MYRVPEEIKQKCISDYINGDLTQQEIHNKYNVGLTTLYRWLLEMKHKRLKPEKPEMVFIEDKALRKQLIREEFANGKTLKYIGEKYGYSKVRVHELCRDIPSDRRRKKGEKKKEVCKTLSNFDKSLLKVAKMRSKIQELKQSIKPGDKVKFELVIDRHTEGLEITVTQVTDSCVFGRTPTGRIESVMWNDIHCSKVRLIS